MNYGFADEINAEDSLMLAPPLPRSEEEASSDDLFARRMALLSSMGAEPRIFLPQPSDEGVDQRVKIEDALRMLSVFAMTAEELEAASSGAHFDVRKRSLMILLRLLQQRSAAMAVTGSAADDEALLRGGGLDETRRAAICYRLGQKHICGSYLRATGELCKREGVSF